MSHNEFDVLIVGGGCIGSSILKEASMLGIAKLGLVDHGRKSKSATASSAGMLRVFHENIEHAKLALANHHRMEKLFGFNQLACNGSLYFFHKHRYGQYQDILNLLNEAGYPFEVLTTTQGKDRFPEFDWQPEEWAIYEPLGTHYDPNKFSDTLLKQSAILGAEIMDDFEIQRICPYHGRFRVCGPQGVVIARKLILAGGARLLPRLNEIGFSHFLEKKIITTFEAKKNDESFMLPNFFDRESLSFGRLGKGNTVVLSDMEGKKIKVKKWEQHFRENFSEDSYSPERRGVLGEVPGYTGLFLASGWGGTAFKFSLEIGHQMGKILEYHMTKRGSLS